jgi:alkyl sulfatase BDS1-like metallo-beta-lactamase superfamily hydrolase
MSTDTKEAPAKEAPPLANLVLAGDQQTEAVAITDFIFMAKDISNAYLITTADGDVMVNTGFMDNAERNKKLLTPHRTGALRWIFLTQAHADHYGCVPDFLEQGTKIGAGRRFSETWNFFDELGPFLERRSRQLWASTIKRGDDAPKPPKVVPDLLVEDRETVEQGGRTFELIATPGGESLDSICVWMPKERVVFTGNLFGPVFLAMPNLNTTRGDKPRLVVNYLASLERVRDLGAELLITGHGDPIRGAEKIRADLDRMHAAVSYITEQTIAGMNAGKDVHTLMREITLPEALKIGEFHGKVSWAVKAIWHENAGWFYYDSTTALYGVPRASVDSDLAELAGGADKLAERAQQKVAAGKALEAVHLLDVALGAEPDNRPALEAKKAALQALLADSGGTNLSEVMWLRSEMAAADKKLGVGV